MAAGFWAGQTALVTGASSGIGADIARVLAEGGANLVVVARRRDQLEALKAGIEQQYGVKVTVFPMDLLDRAGVGQLYDALKAQGLAIDILVNNAGFGVYGEFMDSTWDRLHTMLELDIVTLTQLTRAFLPDMVARKRGYVLQVASTASFQPCPTYAAYGAAKAYVLNFSEALNFELRNTGVSVTALCPGVTATEFFQVAGQNLTSFQKASMMQSIEVARIGVTALQRRRPAVVAGFLNAFLAWSVRFFPRSLAAWVTYRFMREA